MSGTFVIVPKKKMVTRRSADLVDAQQSCFEVSQSLGNICDTLATCFRGECELQ